MNPETPPMTKTKMKPARNRNVVFRIGRPVQMVAIQAEKDTALGRTISSDTTLKKARARLDRPVANMWCSQTPNPSTMVSTVASATAV
jgi:hypothetical protein